MTRQFNIDPRLLCQQHLLGEHSEMHEGVGLIRSEKCPWSTEQMEGQARSGNIDTTWFQPRHHALADELERRGMNHNSPMEYDDELQIGDGAVDDDESLGTLMKCSGCRPRLLAALERIPRDRWETYGGTSGDQHTRPPTAWHPNGHPFESELEAIASEMDSTRLDTNNTMEESSV